MKNLKYILILVILTCSVTAYGGSNVSIGISFQSAPQPVYIYRSVPVFQRVVYTCPQTVYVCQQPVYVTPAPVYYTQPEWSFGFSWGDGHNYYGGRDGFRGGRDNYRGGHDNNRGGRQGGGRGHR